MSKEPILNAQYRRFVRGLVSPAVDSRRGLRAFMKKATNVQGVGLLVGVATEAFELVECLGPWIIGSARRDEVDEKNLHEEFGDLLFYTVGACKLFKVPCPSLKKKIKLDGTPAHQALILNASAGRLLDYVKKAWYGQELKYDSIRSELEFFAYTLFGFIYTVTGDTAEGPATRNFKKLEKRYPGGFSTAKSIARADKAESAPETVDKQ